jgi:hypothetical protein
VACRSRVRSVAEQGAIAHRTSILRRGPLFVAASVAVASITSNKPILVLVVHRALCSGDELGNGGTGARGCCSPVSHPPWDLGAVAPVPGLGGGGGRRNRHRPILNGGSRLELNTPSRWSRSWPLAPDRKHHVGSRIIEPEP